MKKSKLVAILLAMLMLISSLGAVTVYAKDSLLPSTSKEESTGKNPGKEEEESGKNPGKEEQEAESGNAPVLNTEAVDAWLTYIAYEDKLTATPLWAEEDLEVFLKESADTRVEIIYDYLDKGLLIAVTAKDVLREVIEEGDTVADEPLSVVAAQEETVCFYNAETLEVMLEVKAFTPDFSKGDFFTQEDVVEISWSVHSATGAVHVEKTVYAEDGENEGEYLAASTFKVMLANGQMLTEKWMKSSVETEMEVAPNTPNHYELTVGENVYVLKNGEVIATFKKGMQYDLPDYDNAAGTWFTQGDYTYLVNEQPMQPIASSGELNMVVFPGVSFQVMDKNFRIVAEYESTGDAIAGYAVLDNGNVFVSQYTYLHEDATDYDVNQDGMKISVSNVIVSVADGSVTKVEGKFLLYNLYTNATALIDTPINRSTASLILGNATLKQGAFLAQMAEIKDATINTREMDFVAMGNDGTVKEKLPAFAANQYGYLGFFTQDKPIVATVTVGNLFRFYTVNPATGVMSLFFNMNRTMDSVQLMNDSLMVYKDKIYSTKGKSLYDLSDYDSYQVYGDVVVVDNSGDKMLIMQEEGYSSENITVEYLYGNYEYAEDAALFLRTASGEVQGLYNKRGEAVLLAGEIGSRTGKDSEGNTVHYSVSLEIVGCQVVGDAVMVRVRKVYEVESYAGEEDVAIPSENVFYVLK